MIGWVAMNNPTPTSHEIVRGTLAGIRRDYAVIGLAIRGRRC